MRFDLLLILLVLNLTCIPAFAQQPPPSDDQVQQQVQRLMDIEVQLEQMVPPGMSIVVKETSRKGKSGNGLTITNRIYIKGAPPDTVFQWLQWPVNQEKPTLALDGITAAKDGLLVCAGRKPEQCGDPNKPDDPIDFIATPLKGEPTRAIFIAQDVKIAVVFVSDPVATTDRGCTLSATRLTSTFELAFFTGSGYPPNTDIHYRFTSEKTSDRIIKSDNNGFIRVSLIPFPGNKREGTAKFRIMEESCSPEVSYKWGAL